ncbi:MAG: hypothetical protein U5J97_06220 [Trueperaceae bacterium]|nr:hypothetical protein [Trueperaceae bacterium]
MRRDTAPVQQDHAVGGLLGHVDLVGGEQHGAAGLGPLAHQPPHLACGTRIETHHRLVDHQHRRVVQQRSAEGEFLAHAVRVRLDPLVLHLQQPEARQPRLGPRLGGRHLAEPAQEAQQLPAGQLGVQVRPVGNVAQLRLRGDRIARHVEAGHANVAGGRADQPRDDLDGRGLARAVGAQQRQDLAGPGA